MNIKNSVAIAVVIGLSIGGYMAISSSDTTPQAQVEVSEYAGTLASYFDIQKALVKSDLGQAQHAASTMGKHLGHGVHQAATLKEARAEFEGLTQEIETLVEQNGTPTGMSIGKYHCPMANGNKGASWLQDKEGTLNPYYGSRMLRCGSKIETL